MEKFVQKIPLSTWAIIFGFLVASFFLGRITSGIPISSGLADTVTSVILSIPGPFIVGLVLWFIGTNETNKRLKQDAIRDLMTYRGDYAGTNFTTSLNKVAIIFHDNEEIRSDIRKLYDIINNQSSESGHIARAIVGLIYKLCHKNGFPGLTEYDIDQSFVKTSQNPDQPLVSSTVNSFSREDVPLKEKKKKKPRSSR